MGPMSLAIKINGSVSILRNIRSFHYFADFGELAIYCKDGTWIAQDVKVEAINSYED